MEALDALGYTEFAAAATLTGVDALLSQPGFEGTAFVPTNAAMLRAYAAHGAPLFGVDTRSWTCRLLTRLQSSEPSCGAERVRRAAGRLARGMGEAQRLFWQGVLLYHLVPPRNAFGAIWTTPFLAPGRLLLTELHELCGNGLEGLLLRRGGKS